MTTAIQPTAHPAEGGLLDRIAGGHQGLDRTLFFVVAGMVMLSFKTAPWQTLHALAWILMIGKMTREGRWTVPGPPRWAIAWGIFAGWVLLSSALGPAPGASLYDGKKLLNLLVIFLVGAVLRDARDCAMVLAAACGTGALMAVIGLYQFATTTDHIAYRAHGVTHHMTFSGMLLVTICMVLPLLTFRLRRGDLLWWGYTVLAALALLATLTRSAWIGLAVALTVVLAFKNPRWLLALPVALVVLFASVPEVRERTLSIIDTRGDYSNVQRLSMYRTGLRMIAAHPLLGVGGRHQIVEQYLDFEDERPEPPPGPAGEPREPYQVPDHLHSNVLQIAAAFGLPALIAWFAALAVFLREVWRVLPRRRDVTDERGRLRRNIVLGSLSAAAGFVTMGMLEYNFGDSEVSVLFFFALAVPFVVGRSAGPEPGETG